MLPLFHKVGRLKLTARQINVSLADAVTRQGIKVAVQGVATFKIGADEESIRNAAERFLEAEEDEVDSIVKNVLEGSLRSIVGTLTVEELNLDRMKFQQAVQDAAKSDLATSGLQIDSFTIQAIRDESGYMELIGQQETARRERDARMAKAAADQEAAVREAEASRSSSTPSATSRSARPRSRPRPQPPRRGPPRPGRSPRPRRPRRSSASRPSSPSSRPTASRRSSSPPRSAPPRPRPTPRSSAPRARSVARIAQAQADAERVKLAGQAEAAVNVTKGEANARVILVNAQSEAEKTKLEGNAEAGIVFTKGEAEAKALELRAQAYRQFNEAAVIQTVLSMLPEIVRAAAEPMGKIEDLTVLSTDGASELVRNATRTVAEASAVSRASPASTSRPDQLGDGWPRRDDGGGPMASGGSEGGKGGGGKGRAPRPSATASFTGATAGRRGRCDVRHGHRQRGTIAAARRGARRPARRAAASAQPGASASAAGDTRRRRSSPRPAPRRRPRWPQRRIEPVPRRWNRPRRR